MTTTRREPCPVCGEVDRGHTCCPGDALTTGEEPPRLDPAPCEHPGCADVEVCDYQERLDALARDITAWLREAGAAPLGRSEANLGRLIATRLHDSGWMD